MAIAKFSNMDLVEYVLRHVMEKGYQPSQKELGEHFGVSYQAVQQRLGVLKKEGIVEVFGDRAIHVLGVKFKLDTE